jgi:hypothetical protein
MGGSSCVKRRKGFSVIAASCFNRSPGESDSSSTTAGARPGTHRATIAASRRPAPAGARQQRQRAAAAMKNDEGEVVDLYIPRKW